MQITLRPRTAFNLMLYCITFLLIADASGLILKFVFHHDYVFGLIPFFDFDREMNIPTLYATLQLIIAGILLGLIAAIHWRKRLDYLPWVFLALIFMFLAIDEFTSIHETIIQPLRQSLHTDGLLYFAWIIPYGIATFLLGIIYIRYMVRLPRKTMILFILSGTIFVSGAIGLEMIGGKFAEINGRNNISYGLLYTCEEFLEMLGIAVFIYAQLMYVANEFGTARICLEEDTTPAPPSYSEQYPTQIEQPHIPFPSTSDCD